MMPALDPQSILPQYFPLKVRRPPLGMAPASRTLRVARFLTA